MKTRLTIVIVALSVLLVGCGGGSKGSSTTQVTDGKKVTETTIAYQWPPVTVKGADKDVALGLDTMLQVNDLPEGWNTSGAATTAQPNNLAIDEAFVQCMFGAAPSTASVYLVSPVMHNSDGTQVAQSFTRVVGSKADAQKDFSTFNAERASSCEEAMYYRQKNLANDKVLGKKFGDAKPDKIPTESFLPSDGSKDLIAIRVFVSPRDAKPTYIDMFAYGNKRFETVVLFQSSTGPPSSTMESAALGQVKQRVQRSANLAG